MLCDSYDTVMCQETFVTFSQLNYKRNNMMVHLFKDKWFNMVALISNLLSISLLLCLLTFHFRWTQREESNQGCISVNRSLESITIMKEGESYFKFKNHFIQKLRLLNLLKRLRLQYSNFGLKIDDEIGDLNVLNLNLKRVKT